MAAARGGGAFKFLQPDRSVNRRLARIRQAGGALAQPAQQSLDITGAPEIALQPLAPAAGQFQGIHQRPEQAQIAEAQFKVVQAQGAHGVKGQAQDFGFAFGGIVQAQQFDASLEKLGGTFGAVGLIAEGQPIVGNPRRKFRAAVHRMLANGNGEIGAQRQLAARRIGQGESAAADFLAGTVEKNFRRLQDRRFLADIAARAEQLEQGDGLIVQRADGGGVIKWEGSH